MTTMKMSDVGYAVQARHGAIPRRSCGDQAVIPATARGCFDILLGFSPFLGYVLRRLLSRLMV